MNIDDLNTDQEFFKVPEIAKLFGIDQQKVLRWIAYGHLNAIDVSLNQSQRPRWRIHRKELAAFLRRSSKPHPKTTRRRKPDPDVIEFY